MGVSDHRAEMPVKKLKNSSDCPDQGSFKRSFHKCFGIGPLLHRTFTACCVCGRLRLCLGGKKKKEKIKKTRQKQPANPPQPVARNAEETQTASERILPVLQRAAAHGEAAWKRCARTELCDADACCVAWRPPEPSRRPPNPPGAPRVRRQPPAREQRRPGSASVPQA